MKIIKLLTLAAALALLTACSSSPRINVDYDPEHDFAMIKSYHIVDRDRGGLNDILEERVINAIDASMSSRQLSKVEAGEADVLVDFMVTAKDKTRVTSYNTMHSYNCYRCWGGGYGGQQVDVRQYTEGSLIIDLHDPKTKKTFWRGVGTKAIGSNRTPEQRDATAREYTEAIVSEMPLPGRLGEEK